MGVAILPSRPPTAQMMKAETKNTPENQERLDMNFYRSPFRKLILCLSEGSMKFGN